MVDGSNASPASGGLTRAWNRTHVPDPARAAEKLPHALFEPSNVRVGATAPRLTWTAGIRGSKPTLPSRSG